jgi:D-xylose transport system ATP-binding protein
VSTTVTLSGVAKRFGGVTAVDGVDLALATGEVLALVGPNGAGKSTLLEMLSGARPPDAGEIRFAVEPVTLRSPRDAERRGVVTLHQHLALADTLDPVPTVYLGPERTRRGLLDEAAIEREARALLERHQPGFDAVRAPVRALSGGQRQLVAIARALRLRATFLLMDEPTAALGPGERHRVADLVRRLAADGLGIVLVSHDLESVLALADRVAVMRGGRLVAVRARGELDAPELAALVIGA